MQTQTTYVITAASNVSVHKDNDNDHLCDICGVTLAMKIPVAAVEFMFPRRKVQSSKTTIMQLPVRI